MELSDSEMNYFEMLDWFPPLPEGEIIFKEQTFFFFISSTMSNTCSLLHVGVQIVSFTDRSFLQISLKDCSANSEIWSVMTDDQP